MGSKVISNLRKRREEIGEEGGTQNNKLNKRRLNSETS